MEAPSTPRPMGTQNADFTRPIDPPTPYIGDRLLKRCQTEHTTAPGPLLYGGKTRKTTTAAVALQEGIKASISEATRTAEILKDFVTRTDTFTSGYKRQRDQQIAKAVSNVVTRALVAFYKESFALARSISLSKTPHALSYASITRQSNNNNAGAPKGQTALKKSPVKPT